MARDVQLPEPAADLLEVAERVTPGWIRGSIVAVAVRGGHDPADWGDEVDAVVAEASERLLDELADLLAADVDEQATNPLALYRGAVRGPTELLQAHGVEPPSAPDRFAAERFPDDVYSIGPATWADVHPDLHEPGLTWGAWKAMTVLRRRRDEGLR